MRTDSKDFIANQSILRIRDFLKKIQHYAWNEKAVSRFLKVNHFGAQEIIKALKNEGYIEIESSDDEVIFWRTTNKGNTLVNATAAKPILKSTAERKISELIERVNHVNQNDHFLYSVDIVAVFGSYLTNAEKVNDIDIAIKLEYKDLNRNNIAEFHLKKSSDAQKKGRKFKTFEEKLYWPLIEVYRYLKSRSRSIELHTFEELEELIKKYNTKSAIIYKRQQEI